MSIEKILEAQKSYYRSNETLNLDFRIRQLGKLKSVIKENEGIILKALKEDLYKSDFEGYITEIGILYEEINLAVKNLRKWAKREKVKTSIMYFPATSYIYKEPYGVVLIIGPFNYPFQLVVSPLIGAIAGGNCAIVKPSEHTVVTSKVLEKIINDNFDEKYIKVVDPLGGREVVTELLESNFDKIFFTGSVKVGKIVMEKAARKLIPITLELGGKSPCIVDKDANIKMSAKRIVWGKYLNAGQTCVAPDYLYVHKDIKDELLKEMVKEIKLQFGEDNRKSLDYPRIIRVEEVDRLAGYIDEGEVYYGGEIIREAKYIAPTILTNIKDGSKILEEEIFGPILPVYEFNNLQDVLDKINDGQKPLALYYFSQSQDQIEKVLRESSSGGVTINDTILHVSSSFLPFGGVGNSGMGSYHGKNSFLCFSHSKAVLKRGTFIEFSFRFAPFKDKIKLVRKVFK